MAYLKDELSGFIPEEISADIIRKVTRGSSIMRLSRIESMKSDKKKIPVLTSGAGAYWVSEGERIKTSGATWIHPEITAKKLAVIVPVTKEKLEDASIDVFSELSENIAEAFYTAIDAAAIFGTDSPFATSLIASVGTAGSAVTETGSLDKDISDMLAKIEEAGYDPDGIAAGISVKNTLRRLRDANGAPIYLEGTDSREIYSQPIEFVRNGAWDKSKAAAIAGEWKYSVVGIRSGIEFEILKEATLQGTVDSDGKPVSLAEQDMIAIKAAMRIGYLVVKDDAFAAVVPETKSTEDPNAGSDTGSQNN